MHDVKMGKLRGLRAIVTTVIVVSTVFFIFPHVAVTARAATGPDPHFGDIGWNWPNANNTVYVTTDTHPYGIPASVSNKTVFNDPGSIDPANYVSMALNDSYSPSSFYYYQGNNFIIDLHPMVGGGNILEVPGEGTGPNWNNAVGNIHQKLGWFWNLTDGNIQSTTDASMDYTYDSGTNVTGTFPSPARGIDWEPVIVGGALLLASAVAPEIGIPLWAIDAADAAQIGVEATGVFASPMSGNGYVQDGNTQWFNVIGGTLNATGVQTSGLYAGYYNGTNLFSATTKLQIEIGSYAAGDSVNYGNAELYAMNQISTLNGWTNSSNATIELFIRPAISLGGYVNLTGNVPAGNCQVLLSEIDPQTQSILAQNYVTTNSQGYWHFFGKPDEDYRITAILNDGFGQQTAKSISIQSSNFLTGSVHEENNIVLGDTAITGTVGGLGVGQNGLPHPINNAIVTVESEGSSFSVRTNSIGFFAVGVNATGVYGLTVQASGYNVASSTVDVSSIGSVQSTNAFSSMRGIADLPPYITSYCQIMITNTQNVSTQDSYNQELVINSSRFSQLEEFNLHNVEFFYANGTVIPSWLESGNINYSYESVYWLKLNDIPALSSQAIYIGFSSVNPDLFLNKSAGEAPQLSTAYGQYDTGAKVFADYFNGVTNIGAFNVGYGLNLSNDTAVSEGGSIVRALHLTGESGNREEGFVYITPFFETPNSSYWIEGNYINPGNLSSPSHSNGEGIDVMGTGPSTTDNGVIASNSSTANYYEADQYMGSNGAWSITNQYGSYNGQWMYGTIQLNSSGANVYAMNSPSLYSFSYGYWDRMPNEVGNNTSMFIGSFYADADGYAANAYYNWVRVRIAPPNDVMPAVVGPATIGGWAELAAINNQAFATPDPFQLKVDFNVSAYQSLESPSLANVEFTWANGTLIPSWLEFGSLQSADAVFWLKVPMIDTLSSISFFAVFLNNSNVMNGISIGESPTLSPTYAQYDNGVRVFDWYVNFAGTSRPPGFNQWTFSSVDNGLQINAHNQSITGVGVSTNATFGPYITTDMYGKPLYVNGVAYSAMQFGYSDRSLQLGNPSGLTYVSFPWDQTQTDYPYKVNVWTVMRDGADASSMLNYTDPHSTTSASTASLSLGDNGQGNAYPSLVYWWLVRNTPPMGVMPTVVTYGTVTFNESGLNGQWWSVNISGIVSSATLTTSGSIISFYGAGEYGYTVSGPAGYYVHPESGSFALNYYALTVSISFSVGGVIEGYVKDTDGIPLSGALVSARQLPIWVNTTTDSSGYYTLTVPTTGSYDMEASEVGYNNNLGTADVVSKYTWWNATMQPNPSGCVLYGTYIALANGTETQVQNLTTGMHILSYNVSNQSLLNGTVVKITVTNVTQITDVNGMLFVSGATDQPLYVQLQNGTEEWVVLGQLSTSMKLLDPLNGTWIPISSIRNLTGTFTVYDITASPSFQYSATVGGDFIANGILMDDKIA